MAALCAYLAIPAERFAVQQDRYFRRLGRLLEFHGAVPSAHDVGPDTFRDAVVRFQRDQGLPVDGIPGEETAWALNLDWALTRALPLVDGEPDRCAPPGAACPRCDVPGPDGPSQDGPSQDGPSQDGPSQDGPSHDGQGNDGRRRDRHQHPPWQVRSDVAGAVAALRAELEAAGVPLPTVRGTRPLTAQLPPNRSAVSIHYSGVAIDLAIASGTAASGEANSPDQRYVVTRDGTRWRLWARTDDGENTVLDAIEWSAGMRSTRRVSGCFLDVSAVARRRGFTTIGPHRAFHADYVTVHWWHLQYDQVFVPWISQFGSEILAIADYSISDLEAQPRLWENRKRLFQRGRDGWW